MNDQPVIEIGTPLNETQKVRLSNISSDSLISSQEDKSEKTDAQLDLIYINLIENYQKLQYRKILTAISKIDNYSGCKSFWRINHLRLTCIQKIIERKLQKYHSEKNIPKITNWLKIFNRELNAWYTDMAFQTDDKGILVNKLELYITFALSQCYSYAKYCIHQSFLSDCIGFLALGERLIKNTSDFFVSPDTYSYAEMIYLFLSSLYITNENFDSAKKYVIIVLKLAYKELELRLNNDLNSLVCLENYTKQEQDSIMKIFFNITVSFFQLGVCYENEAELEKCYQAYKQAKWFGKLVKGIKATSFFDILYDIEQRARIRSAMVDFFHKEEANIPETPKTKQKKNILVFNEEEKLKKFSKIQKFIEKLKLMEVDDDEVDLLNNVNEKPFSQRVGVVTKTIHVLNYLMSEKFQNVLDKMGKIEINNLNKDTRRVIQKKIISIKNNQRMKLLEEEKEKENQKEKINLYKKESFKFSPMLTKSNNYYMSTVTTNNSSSRANTAASRRPEKLKEKEIKRSNKEQTNKTERPKTSKSSRDEIPKIKYSKYLFNKNFQKKIAFLDNQYNKELKFQKDMLKCKEEEKTLAYEPFNERKINHICENFYSTTLKKEMKSAKEREKMLKKKEINKKQITSQRRIKLNYKYSSEKASRENTVYKLTNKEDNTISINQNYLNTIQNELDLIEQHEKSYQNKLRNLRAQSAKNRKHY